MHACVGAHLQGLLDGISGLVGADGQHRDRALPRTALGQLEACLDRVLVELRKQTVNAQTIGGVVRLVEPGVRLGVGYVLDTDDDLHRWLVPFRRENDVGFRDILASMRAGRNARAP